MTTPPLLVGVDITERRRESGLILQRVGTILKATNPIVDPSNDSAERFAVGD